MANPGPPYGQYPGSDPTRPQQPGWAPPPGPSPYQPQQPTWGYQAPEPPKRSNTPLIIALAAGGIVLLIAVIVVAVVLTDSKSSTTASSSSPVAPNSPSPSGSSSPTDSPSSPSSSSRTLTVPDGISGFTRSTGSVSDRLLTSMRESMIKSQPADADAFAKARLGLYTKGDQKLIYLGVQGSDSPAFASELASKSSSDEVDSLFIGANVTNATDFPAGPLGGTLRCGKGTSNGTPMVMCGWADSSVVGMLLGVNMTSTSDLAGITLAFRTAAEH